MVLRKFLALLATASLSAALFPPAYAKVCQKPNGKYYGIPDQDKCIAPAKEASGSPISFLGINVGSKQNYDAAKEQGEFKNIGRHWRDIMGAVNKEKRMLSKEWVKISKKYSGTFQGLKESNTIRDASIEDFSKLFDKGANISEWLVKAIKAAKLPENVKPITDKITSLETQQAALLRASKGPNTWQKDGVPQNAKDDKRYGEINKKLSKIQDELNNNLYPQVRVRLNLPSAAREKS